MLLLYLWVWAESELGQCAGFRQINQQQEERQRLTAGTRRDRLETDSRQRGHEYERQMRFILQSGELFTQKLNDHSAEHKAGEDGEQTSDTWTQNTINTF